jgi:hypothetical protein
MIILPKPHLSFSQITLWLGAKETYRKKYYPEKMPDYGQTPEMAFGNTVTEAMEKGEDWVSFIPHYPTFEYDASFVVDEVPVMAYIDNVDLNSYQFGEQKTGRTPWTQNKVNKHLQLDIYSMLMQLKLGFVQDDCYLIWVEAQKKVKTVELPGGHIVTAESAEIELTGNYTQFKRTITQKERDACRELIVRVGKEISEDYRAMKHLYN